MKKEEINWVEKVWGYEQWLVNNDHYCGKLLWVSEGAICSYHMHKVKRETFYCPSGKLKLTIQGVEYDLSPMARPKTIEPGEFHKFEALEDSMIIEISTHHEDDDVTRLSESVPGKAPAEDDNIAYPI